MQRQREEEVRPQAGHLEATESATATGSTSSLLELSDSVANLAYVVIVSTSDDRARRRPYLSLHSAERAVERAESRGHAAALHLCQLIPVVPQEIGGVTR